MGHTFEVILEQAGPSTSKGTVRSHTVYVDRPTEGGGADRGPRGGEFLLIAAGGCFMTHLLAAIRARDAEVSDVRVVATGTLGGTPERFTELTINVAATCPDAALFARLTMMAERACQVRNTLRESVPVSLVVQTATATTLQP
jgi:putative redox protein